MMYNAMSCKIGQLAAFSASDDNLIGGMMVVPEMEFSNHYVAFLDVLGFKQMASDPEWVKRYSHAIDKNLEIARSADRERTIKLLAVSDSIIVASQAIGSDWKSRIKSLRAVIAAVREIQSACVIEDIWIRGGVSFGPLFFDEQVGKIFGQSLIDAYLLESKAKYPRVLIGPGVISSLNEEWGSESFLAEINWHGYNSQFKNSEFVLMGDGYLPSNEQDYTPNPMNTHFRKDCPFFVNYLYRFKDPEYIRENGDKMFGILRNHIHDNAIEYFDKYNWVVEYVQHLVSGVDQSFEEKLSKI